MFKRISIFLILLLTLLAFTVGVGATDAGLFIVKDAANTYIDYVDADGTSIMKIDDTDGVTIASYTASNTYASMTLTSTTDASSLTAGSFVTPGGIACAKQLYIGDDIDMSVSATGTYDITLKDSVADALSIVGGSTDMIVFCTDTDAITITPPVTITGAITNDSTTDTSSATTGAIQTDGGIGIVKALWVGTTSRLVGNVTMSAALSVDSTTDTTSTTTGSIHTDGGVGIAKNLWVGVNTTLVGTLTQTGAVTVSTSGAGVDVTIYGNTADYRLLFDADGDTNGALYVGADTYGLAFELYGDITGCGVFWNPTTDTNGTLTIGGSGGSKGVDVIVYGKTNGKYVKWDRSADALVLVGTLTTTAGLTLNSVDPLTVQFGGVDWLQMDEAAIASFAGAANTAGHAIYIESEDGGADGGAGTGSAGGAISLKTGDGSASATATAVGGAGGAFTLTTGTGLTGNTTGNGGVGGAIGITAGAGGASGAGAGVGGTGGTITLTAGAGGGAGGGTAGAPGKVDIAAGLLHMGVQTIDMSDTTVVTTLVPGTPTGTLITGNILYVDANGAGAEILKLPPEADGNGVLLVVVNTGGETITIVNDADGAVLTLETLNTAFLVCDGTTWRGAVCVP